MYLKNGYECWLRSERNKGKRVADSTIPGYISRLEGIKDYSEEVIGKPNWDIFTCDSVEELKQYQAKIEAYQKQSVTRTGLRIHNNLTAPYNNYLDFIIRREVFYNALKTAPDIEPSTHNASYGIVQLASSLLVGIPESEFDVSDLDAFWFLCTIIDKEEQYKKQIERIRQSHLPSSSRQQLIDAFSSAWSSSYGMFGKAFNTYTANGTDDDSAKRFQKVVALAIGDIDDERINQIQEILNQGIKGMRTASLSQYLHCLQPTVFPILNGHEGYATTGYDYLGIELADWMNPKTYISNTKAIAEFCHDHFSFKNYRVLDLEINKLPKPAQNNDELVIEGDEEPEECPSKEEQRYWLLVSNPAYWSFTDVQVGDTVTYTLKGEKQHRKIKQNFYDAKVDNPVIGYEAKSQTLVALAVVNSEQDGENIYFRKTEDLEVPIPFGQIKDCPELENMQGRKGLFRGSLFKLSKEEYEFILAKIREQNPETSISEDLAQAVGNEEDEVPQQQLRPGVNIILFGPPGTGKTFNVSSMARLICENDGSSPHDLLAKAKAFSENKHRDDIKWFNKELNNQESGRVAFTTFHQSYGYEEFIEGIRPVILNVKDKTAEATEAGSASGELQYEIRPGVFKAFCERAEKDPDNAYVFVIDEINRGNISKVFGELITLIEDSKRAGKGDEKSAILPYSGALFTVPSNVSIIGTMNTADRSIALMDTALRRRFAFVEMTTDLDLLGDKISEPIAGINIKRMVEIINQRITVLLDREHVLGHALFSDLFSKDNPQNETVDKIDRLAEIFQNKVVPLLQEYFYNDYRNIYFVLGDNQKNNDADRFVIKDISVDLPKLFGVGEDAPNLMDDELCLFRLNDRTDDSGRDVYHNPDAYIGIYQPKKD